MKPDPYEWHRLAMAGKKPPVHTTPECGWFLRPISKNGNEKMYLPASVYWESETDPETGEILSDEIMRCEIGGVQCDPTDSWLFLAKRPISKSEYDERVSALFRDHVEVP